MATSGVSASPDCIQAFNDLKLVKDTKWIVFQIAGKEIVVEKAEKKTSEDEEAQWNKLREHLLNSKTTNSKTGQEGPGARYAVYDFEYTSKSNSYGEGQRNKIIFLSWIPDTLSPNPKMIYSSSKEALKRTLEGIGHNIQATCEDDIEYQNVLEGVQGRS